MSIKCQLLIIAEIPKKTLLALKLSFVVFILQINVSLYQQGLGKV